MEELRRIREDREWSQQKLADVSGVNKATINQIERGRRSPNIETLEKLAEALEVELADFFPKAQAPLLFEEPQREASTGRHVADEALVALREYLDLSLMRAEELRGQLIDTLWEARDASEYDVELDRSIDLALARAAEFSGSVGKVSKGPISRFFDGISEQDLAPEEARQLLSIRRQANELIRRGNVLANFVVKFNELVEDLAYKHAVEEFLAHMGIPDSDATTTDVR